MAKGNCIVLHFDVASDALPDVESIICSILLQNQRHLHTAHCFISKNTSMVITDNNNNDNNNYSIILSVSDAVMIPTISDFFETRMHFEYLINGTRTFAGVS